MAKNDKTFFKNADNREMLSNFIIYRAIIDLSKPFNKTCQNIH